MITELKIILEITNVLTKLISKYSSSKKESDIMNIDYPFLIIIL